MSELPERWTDQQILDVRPPKHPTDPHRPYSFLVEPELTVRGQVEEVATIFLTNRECPFRCLMCDLWRNTTEQSAPAGAVRDQVMWALQQYPYAPAVKLYNAGSFFDRQAIQPADLAAITELISTREEVIIECHPRLIGPSCLEFAAAIAPAR